MVESRSLLQQQDLKLLSGIGEDSPLCSSMAISWNKIGFDLVRSIFIIKEKQNARH